MTTSYTSKTVSMPICDCNGRGIDNIISCRTFKTGNISIKSDISFGKYTRGISIKVGKWK